MDETILWRRIDVPGHETVRVYGDDDGWYLDGSSIFLWEGKSCRLEYLIECDTDWQTAFVSIDGWVGDETIAIEIDVDQGNGWTMNGEEIEEVEGCIDIDLNFSPVTNLLPIKRSNIAVGQAVDVRAAWLRFPSFKLEPLSQVYTRLSKTTYRYESGGGKFVTEIEVNETGLVTKYPDFFEIEAP
jgi:uncharacterized protein